MKHGDHHDEFGGLERDLRQLSRRGMLRTMLRTAAAGVALVPLVNACNTDDGSTVDSNGSSDGNGNGTCSAIPSETAGPYPGDGTNGPNALTLSGFERSDIRTSVGTASGTADGVPLTVTLTIVDASTCEPVVGRAVYIWHCTRDGNYSMYTGSAQTENYLRGIQVTDANGQVTFTTIFPGCYSGRWPHIHFEVYSSIADATNGTNKIAVSQLAMPKTTCQEVYATSGYESSVGNLSQTSLASDNVFGNDSAVKQLPTITGTAGNNLAAALTVGV